MAATDARAARRAVIAALTTVTSKPRGLPLASIFNRAAPARSSQRAVEVLVKKRCLVSFVDSTIEAGAAENGSLIRHFYSVRIDCFYHAGSDLFNVEADKALEAILADQPLIRAALCSSGALALDPSGNDTALDDYALHSAGYRMAGPTPSGTATDGSRTLNVTHFFTASIDVTQPT